MKKFIVKDGVDKDRNIILVVLCDVMFSIFTYDTYECY